MICKPITVNYPDPEFQNWLASQPKGTTQYWNFLYNRADVGLAAIFSTLFCPEFVDVQGCVLLAQHYEPQNFQSWWTRLEGDRMQVEKMINHVHAYDLFKHAPTIAFVDYLPLYERVACTLRNCWECALHQAFP
ncbi:MAG TPA: hypothetical protein VKT80_15825, partial [Chloroflexota bacterium]|nr:hypothetical protein [Chloroflexota bacterium]